MMVQMHYILQEGVFRYFEGCCLKSFPRGKPSDPNLWDRLLIERLFWHNGQCLGHQEAYRLILAASETQVLNGLGPGVVKISLKMHW